MKRWLKYGLLIFVFATLLKQGIRTFSASSPTEFSEGLSVVVCHATQRCSVCEGMEKYTRECLEKYFAKEPVTLSMWTYELPENEFLAQKYGIATATVLLVRREKGETQVENLCAEAWSVAGDPEAFVAWLKKSLEKFLRHEPVAETISAEDQILEENWNWE